jgi:hypothetical protein
MAKAGRYKNWAFTIAGSRYKRTPAFFAGLPLFRIRRREYCRLRLVARLPASLSRGDRGVSRGRGTG